MDFLWNYARAMLVQIPYFTILYRLIDSGVQCVISQYPEHPDRHLEMPIHAKFSAAWIHFITAFRKYK